MVEEYYSKLIASRKQNDFYKGSRVIWNNSGRLRHGIVIEKISDSIYQIIHDGVVKNIHSGEILGYSDLRIQDSFRSPHFFVWGNLNDFVNMLNSIIGMEEPYTSKIIEYFYSLEEVGELKSGDECMLIMEKEERNIRKELFIKEFKPLKFKNYFLLGGVFKRSEE